MARDPIFWALAVATLITGFLFFTMLIRQRRERRQRVAAWAAEQAVRRAAQRVVAPAAERVRSRALPVLTYREAREAEDAAPELALEHDHDHGNLAKICPACGSRYRLEYRVCSRDASELAAIN